MSLMKFFNPESVAVVGASREKGKVGYEILHSLVIGGFAGKIYPVNPKADELEGLRCFPSLEDISDSIDLVIIVVPARFVPAVMKQCVSLKITAVVIITAGFKETGKDGLELEEEVLNIARSGGIRIIGPNCLGLMVPKIRLNASFGGDLPAEGGIAYVSQSGALLASILDMANAEGLGFSSLVSIGNKADINELDIMRTLGDDTETRVIAGYLESIGDGNLFVREAESISQKKPILLMKSGGTGAGAAAASSHTGSLAGSETGYECVFERAGIIRCDSIRTQFDFAQAFATQALPVGNSVAVITNAGGPGIMAADAIEREGLTFASLEEDTQKRLADVLPAAANIHNPIDVLGDALADRYEQALHLALEDSRVNIVLVLLTPQSMTECEKTAEAVVRAHEKFPDKPILCAFMGALKVEQGIKILREGGVPQYDSPEAAVRSISALVTYANWRSRPKRVVKLFPVNRHKVEKIIDRHLRQGLREIGEMESKEILEAYGFVTPKGSIATSAEQAASIASQLGFPVVMKIWSPDILHKSDVGGVKVGLTSAQGVMDAFDLMMYRIPQKKPDAKILGVLVQEMCQNGQEVILGMNRDPQFGPLMMFGMGEFWLRF